MEELENERWAGLPSVTNNGSAHMSRQLESETGTTEEHSLNKEARKWATRVAREHKNIIHSQRTLEELECHGPVMSEQTRAELEQKIDEAREKNNGSKRGLFLSQVVRDYNFQLFLQENSVFHKPQPFQFQPSDSDTSFNAVQLVDIEPSPVSAMRMTIAEVYGNIYHQPLRLYGSKLSLFQSRISLQKASVKLKARRSECNSKAIHARNDYLLTLAAANAHQDRYYQTDLVNIMKSIQKLASQYLKKDWLGIKADERSDYRSMYSVWKSLLEGTMQVAQSRLNICENYKNLISEPARTVRCFKEQQLKKVFAL
ncbi:hypothetical protein AV530_010197 [Patagioenas fasciata monilis]|uniref:Uncharacterized protein n=1 Tax=Patagioenas fasciata monilis TaxID=372326 RepID=A0A1V4JGV7_PATFA|nr:hypothetical protein AV530_010197 [Patagioenas fasciata monilis]